MKLECVLAVLNRNTRDETELDQKTVNGVIENDPENLEIFSVTPVPCDSKSDHLQMKSAESDSTSCRSFQSFELSENSQKLSEIKSDLSFSNHETQGSIPSACTSFRSKKSHKCDVSTNNEHSVNAPPTNETAEIQRRSIIQKILTKDVHILGQNHSPRNSEREIML